MKRLAQLSGFIFAIVLATTAQATSLFQLAGSATVEAVDEATSFSLTVDGIVATLTANIGVLNTTAVSGFGVNAPGSGDQTSQIDNAEGTESVSIVFNVPVKLDQIVLSLFTGGATGDLATLKIAGFPSQTLIPTAPALDVYDFTSNNFVPVGQPIVLTYQAGNGFSFDSFSVSIPEPASGLLLLLGMAAAVRLRRHRTH